MREYCRNCEMERDFKLSVTSALDDTYECPNCGLKAKKKTGTGIVVTSVQAVIGIVGLVFGINTLGGGGDS